MCVELPSNMSVDWSVASSVILPTSPAGLTITATGGGHLVVDLLGWFTGPGAAESDDGLFVPLAPTRLLDTRVDRPRLWPDGTIELANPVPGAASLSTNVTLTLADRRGFVGGEGMRANLDVRAETTDVGSRDRGTFGREQGGFGGGRQIPRRPGCEHAADV